MSQDSGKAFVWVLVIILIIVVALIGGYYWFRNYNLKPQTVTPTPTTSTTPTISKETTVTEAEKQQMIEAAKPFIKGMSVPDVQFDIQFKKRVGTLARLEAHATNMNLDPLTVIMEKKNGKWEPINAGTAFPELETQNPELFRD